MRVALALLMAGQIYATTSFITTEEYAQSLYHNPRGIGCQLCHGEHGEGKMIARYKHKGEAKVFEGKPINTLSFPEFYKRLDDKIIGMPHYHLTDMEIQTLYYYLHREEFERAAKRSRKSK